MGLTIELEDHVTMPITGKLEGATTPNGSALSRVNGIREETGGANRWFLPVVSGPIYIFDRQTKTFTTYLDFNGYGDNRGLFKKFFTLTGFGNGVNGFSLDPEYAKNGKFYTTHMEDPSVEAPACPGTHVPTLQPLVYTGHSVRPPDDGADHDAWSRPSSGRSDRVDRHQPVEHTFEGTARDDSSVCAHTQPSAGASGVQSDRTTGDPIGAVNVDVATEHPASRESSRFGPNPQRLDTMVGNSWRIIPESQRHTSTSTVSEMAVIAFHTTTPSSKRRVHARKIGPMACAIRTADLCGRPENPKNNRLVASICRVEHVGNDLDHPQGRQLRISAA